MDQNISTDRKTLDDLAHLAVTDPTKLAAADITRLGDFILDHEEHIAFARRAAGAPMYPRPNGPLGRRLDGTAQQSNLQALASSQAAQEPAFQVSQQLAADPTRSTVVEPETGTGVAEDPEHPAA